MPSEYSYGISCKGKALNITVLAAYTKMPRWVDDTVAEYAKRFGRDAAYALKEIKPEKRGAGVNAVQGMAAEENASLKPFRKARSSSFLTNAAKHRPPSSWRNTSKAGGKTANTSASSSAARTA